MNRPIPPKIPRAEWSQHPRFATQALLLGAHANFRRISAHLVSQAQVAAPLAPIADLFVRWKQAMGGHEAYEERKLYPYLARRWGVSFATAEAGHAVLGVLDSGVRSRLSSGRGLAEALLKHHEALLAHLDYEEELVIPLLLGLTPAEFSQYSNG